MPLPWSGDQFKKALTMYNDCSCTRFCYVYIKSTAFVFKSSDCSNALYMTFLILFSTQRFNLFCMQYNTAASDVEIAALWKVSDFILNLNKKWKVKSNNDQSKGHILHTQSVKFIDKHIPQSPELQNPTANTGFFWNNISKSSRTFQTYYLCIFCFD